MSNAFKLIVKPDGKWVIRMRFTRADLEEIKRRDREGGATWKARLRWRMVMDYTAEAGNLAAAVADLLIVMSRAR
jgi:hypothetical protein